MIPVKLKITEATCVAYIPMTGPYAQIPGAMGRLFGWVAQHGLHPAGMPSGVYSTDPSAGEDSARWELRAPLADDCADLAVDASGCGVKHVEPRVVASAMYRGPYEQIGPAYAEVQEWIRANGYAVIGPPEELYYSEPTTPPQDTLTEIRIPVVKA